MSVNRGGMFFQACHLGLSVGRLKRGIKRGVKNDKLKNIIEFQGHKLRKKMCQRKMLDFFQF